MPDNDQATEQSSSADAPRASADGTGAGAPSSEAYLVSSKSENGRLAAQQFARESAAAHEQQQQSSKDTLMTDAPAESAASPAPIPRTSTPVNAPSPLPGGSGGRGGTTPLRHTNGEGAGPGSRAASAHPEGSGFTMPAEAGPHGAPVRQYLNGNVTGPLLEGMKMIAKEQPKDPLRVLGQFLIDRSKELESSN
ncbi:hypothetical protein NKR23_g8852 [Pleurostoma richardsiae]|uniref:Uncharacterized protein n=1 Tax=Pleurostoma richardsiae TaxID=41990 RepID=A0AA38RIS7_9PEZI|nr:hypothetical protein NKR23_g8852 [Pleurostoma richardsiae]